jgi:CheY-like chemotaxis protein/anti-sigma regulatory factor (Ser/Thr protein kinase)
MRKNEMPEILVVDDSLIDLKVAGRLLEQQPEWTVRYARNGAEALTQIEANLPSLVVTDLQMPELNGLDLVEKVRDEFPLIPVILMTAAGSEQIAVQAIQKGAASYVPKTELSTDLVKTVARVLASSAEARGRRRVFNYLTEVHYVLENDLELLSALVSELRQTVRDRWLFAERDCLQFATAVDEAVVNAYFHGNLEVNSELRIEDADAYYALAEERRAREPYLSRRIGLRLEIGREQVSVRISDDGPGFDPSRLPDPTAPGYLERPCGRGIMLMRTFMDDIQFNEKGNEVTLIKRRVAPADTTSGGG